MLKILSVLTLSFMAASAAAETTFVMKTASGQDYLNLIAATCEDREWKAIELWATKTHFSEQEIPEVQITIDGKTMKSNTGMPVDLNAGKLTTTVINQKYTGTLCEVLAQIVSTKDEKAALLEFFIPFAHAQERNTKEHTVTTSVATLTAAAGAGCAIGAIGGPLGCGVGVVIGGIGGLASVIWSDESASRNLDRFEVDIRRFTQSGAPQFKTCTKHAVQAVNGSKTVNVTRNSSGVMVELRNSGKLIYKVKANPAEDAAFSWCKSSADANRFNAQVVAAQKLARARLQAKNSSSSSKQQRATN